MSALLGGEGYMDAEYRLAETPPPPTPIRKMPIKTRRVTLDGEYEGWWADMRTNAPFGLFLALSELQAAGDEGVRAFAELANLLPRLIQRWNFVDEAGAPIPCDAAGMRLIPTDLLMALVGKLGEGTDAPKP